MGQVKRYNGFKLLNEYSGLFFYYIFFICVQTPFKLEKFKKKSLKWKKDISKGMHKASRMQIMTLKATIWGLFWVNVV